MAELMICTGAQATAARCLDGFDCDNTAFVRDEVMGLVDDGFAWLDIERSNLAARIVSMPKVARADASFLVRPAPQLMMPGQPIKPVQARAWRINVYALPADTTQMTLDDLRALAYRAPRPPIPDNEKETP